VWKNDRVEITATLPPTPSYVSFKTSGCPPPLPEGWDFDAVFERVLEERAGNNGGDRWGKKRIAGSKALTTTNGMKCYFVSDVGGLKGRKGQSSRLEGP